MKKVSKLLSVLLTGIVLFSIFSVSASAKEMSKTEVVKFYHSILKETAEKNEVILIKDDWKSKDSADFSELSGLDLKFTEGLFFYCDDLWHEDGYEDYYYGVYDEYVDAANSEIYNSFSLSWELEWGYTIKSATYGDNKIVIELEDNQEYYDTIKITANLASDNTIKKITKETYAEYEEYSVIKNVPFTTTYEEVTISTFLYDKVPAKSLTLSETNLTLGYGDVAEITYTVGPESATFKDVYVDSRTNDAFSPVYWASEEDGKIVIEALGEGTGTVEVYTYSGDILATCEVTVEYTLWDRIRSIFDDIFFWIGLILGI